MPNTNTTNYDLIVQTERGMRMLRSRAVRGVSYNLINRTHRGCIS